MALKCYRGADGDLEPVLCECEVRGYPNKTISGELMYDNTHFATEQEAWGSILSSWDAGVVLAVRALELARMVVEKATQELAEMSLNRVKAEDKHREWLEGCRDVCQGS